MIRPGLLVEVADLDGLADERGDVVLLDTRLALTGPPGRERYDAGHLPGAVYVDVDADLSSAPTTPPGPGGRHPLPDPDAFVAAMRRSGLRRGSTVVVYDDGPATAAARLWWLLLHYGHGSDGRGDVLVLDGGLAAWTAAGRALSTEPASPEPGDWSGEPGRLPTVDADGVPATAREGLLIDVRAAERFRGEQEPLDPVAGHIPGAVSAPLAGNTDTTGRFLPAPELRRRFLAAGAGAGRDVAAYCGSGVTACQTVLALRLAGFAEPAALYPGSWSGWISEATHPVAIGP